MSVAGSVLAPYRSTSYGYYVGHNEQQPKYDGMDGIRSYNTLLQLGEEKASVWTCPMVMKTIRDSFPVYTLPDIRIRYHHNVGFPTTIGRGRVCYQRSGNRTYITWVVLL
jgi:hypothetical protein